MRLTISGSRQLTITNIRDDENIKKAKKHQDDIYNKLSELEDIEDELGIDLLTLFKALKNGVWFKNGDKVICKQVCFSVDCMGGHFSTDFDWKYGLQGWDLRTNRQNEHWALTKEELKNESNNDKH